MYWSKISIPVCFPEFCDSTSSPVHPVFFGDFCDSRYGRAEWPAPVLMVRVMRMIRNAFKLETPDRVPKVLGRRRFNWNEDQRLILAEGGAKKKKRPKIGEFWYHGALNSLTYCTRNCDWRPTLMSDHLAPHPLQILGCRGILLMDKTWQNTENR